MPTVVNTINTLIGYTDGVMSQPFDFYEHYRIDNVLSNGMVSVGASDTIGENIPLTPDKTSLGSYYHFVRGSKDDLDYESNGLYETYYYKDYAWIHMIIDGKEKEFNTGQWKRGDVYTQPGEEKPIG